MPHRSYSNSTPIRGLIVALGLITILGCEEARAPRAGRSSDPAPGMVVSADAYDAVGSAVPGRLVAAQAPAEAKADPAPKATANRKIIYEATVDLVTEDLNTLEAGLLRLVESRGAYVADSDRSGRAGETRRGSWKVRVPVDGYDTFVRGAIGLGELVSTRANSQDVSAEYYDLDARTAAKKVEEARLLKHLTDSTGRLDEILAVERELARVRGEIEQMQGRLNVLSNLTSLATVTVTATEIKGYIPPQAPTLGHRVARTFAASVASLRTFGESVLLFVVALAPWLTLLIPGAFLLVVALRRAIRFLTRVPAA